MSVLTTTKSLKPNPTRTCECGRSYRPLNSMQSMCVPCLAAIGREKRKTERVTDRKKRSDMKGLPELIAAAQREFNRWIRWRDREQSCICCGRQPQTSLGLRHHAFDAGHYRSTGSASHLRFNEDNVHSQLVLCNRHGAGRAVDYRIGLIVRIGLARVEALESNNDVRKWTREEVLAIAAEYRSRLKRDTAEVTGQTLPEPERPRIGFLP